MLDLMLIGLLTGVGIVAAMFVVIVIAIFTYAIRNLLREPRGPAVREVDDLDLNASGPVAPKTPGN